MGSEMTPPQWQSGKTNKAGRDKGGRATLGFGRKMISEMSSSQIERNQLASSLGLRMREQQPGPIPSPVAIQPSSSSSAGQVGNLIIEVLLVLLVTDCPWSMFHRCPSTMVHSTLWPSTVPLLSTFTHLNLFNYPPIPMIIYSPSLLIHCMFHGLWTMARCGPMLPCYVLLILYDRTSDETVWFRCRSDPWFFHFH